MCIRDSSLRYTATVEALIAKGAKVDLPSVIGEVALHKAALNGHTATVEALVRSGANVNRQVGLHPFVKPLVRRSSPEEFDYLPTC
eukprot:5565838-Pyramimonas_sp.AAC.1